MTKTVKIVLITSGLLLTAGAVYAFTRKKKVVPPAPVKKKTTGGIVVGSSEPTTPDNTSLQVGVDDPQHVMQLQDFLQALHQAAVYINGNCGGAKWPVLSGFNVTSNGSFDTATANAVQFYLNRTSVDLDYLTTLRGQMTAYNKGDKCTYPLSLSPSNPIGITGILASIGSMLGIN